MSTSVSYISNKLHDKEARFDTKRFKLGILSGRDFFIYIKLNNQCLILMIIKYALNKKSFLCYEKHKLIIQLDRTN